MIASFLFLLIVVAFIYCPQNSPKKTYQLNPECATKTNKCQNPFNRLNWTFPQSWYIFSIIFSIILSIIYIKPEKSKYFLIGIFLFTNLLSHIFFNPTASSIWCFMAAILSPIIVGINYYLIRDEEEKEVFT